MRDESGEAGQVRAFYEVRKPRLLPSAEALAQESDIPVYVLAPWPVASFGTPEFGIFEDGQFPGTAIARPKSWTIQSAQPPHRLYLHGREILPGWRRGRPTLRGRVSDYVSRARRHHRTRTVDVGGASVTVAAHPVARREFRRLVTTLTEVPVTDARDTET